MVTKDQERPKAGEQNEPRDILGEGHHTPISEGEPPPMHIARRRHWSQEVAVVRLDAKRRAYLNDPCRRTSEDLYAVRFPEKSDPAEPRNDTSVEHSTPVSPADNVPDDAPLSEH